MQCGEATTGVTSLVCSVVRLLLELQESCMLCGETTIGVTGVLYAVW